MKCWYIFQMYYRLTFVLTTDDGNLKEHKFREHLRRALSSAPSSADCSIAVELRCARLKNALLHFPHHAEMMHISLVKSFIIFLDNAQLKY